MQQIEFNVFYLLRSVKKHLKLFLAINVVIALLSLVYALTAPVKYQSKVVFYPFSPESSDPRLMLYEESRFSVFGYSDQVERFTRIGKSNSVKYALASKYNLYKRYNITTDSIPAAKNQLLEYMTGGVLKFEKGENGGIMLSVVDADRDTAALMCNSVVALIDSINASLLVEKNIKVFNLYKSQANELEKGLQHLKDSINVVVRSKDRFKEYTIKALQSQLNYSAEEFAKVKTKFELSKTLTSRQLNSLYLVEPAQPSFKKAQPNRKLIIAGSIVIGLLLSTVGFTIVEFLKDNKKKFKF